MLRMSLRSERAMPTTLDANVLIYAANDDSPDRAAAARAIESLVAGDDGLVVFWPVVVAFLRVATHPRVFRNPLSLERAFEAVERLLMQPGVVCPVEGDSFLQHLRDEMMHVQGRGKLVHDAHLVALMREHGVDTILTGDRDFSRFHGIRVVNPLA